MSVSVIATPYARFTQSLNSTTSEAEKQYEPSQHTDICDVGPVYYDRQKFQVPENATEEDSKETVTFMFKMGVSFPLCYWFI